MEVGQRPEIGKGSPQLYQIYFYTQCTFVLMCHYKIRLLASGSLSKKIQIRRIGSQLPLIRSPLSVNAKHEPQIYEFVPPATPQSHGGLSAVYLYNRGELHISLDSGTIYSSRTHSSHRQGPFIGLGYRFSRDMKTFQGMRGPPTPQLCLGGNLNRSEGNPTINELD